MEYLNGGPVNFHLSQFKVFPENLVKFHSAQIICGIQFLHSHDIVHRFSEIFLFILLEFCI